MISYDQYENRIKKFAKFRNFVARFKFLFIAVFALMIAAVATPLALKGSLSGEITIASSVYGDAYADPTGVSAFWSSVSYEYAAAGSDNWSSQSPLKRVNILFVPYPTKQSERGTEKLPPSRSRRATLYLRWKATALNTAVFLKRCRMMSLSMTMCLTRALYSLITAIIQRKKRRSIWRTAPLPFGTARKTVPPAIASFTKRKR